MIIAVKVDIRMVLAWENNSGELQIISEKFPNSGKFQNNAINDVKQISLSNVINNIKNDLVPENFFGKMSFLAELIFANRYFWFLSLKKFSRIRNFW